MSAHRRRPRRSPPMHVAGRGALLHHGDSPPRSWSTRTAAQWQAPKVRPSCMPPADCGNHDVGCMQARCTLGGERLGPAALVCVCARAACALHAERPRHVVAPPRTHDLGPNARMCAASERCGGGTRRARRRESASPAKRVRRLAAFDAGCAPSTHRAALDAGRGEGGRRNDGRVLWRRALGPQRCQSEL